MDVEIIEENEGSEEINALTEPTEANVENSLIPLLPVPIRSKFIFTHCVS